MAVAAVKMTEPNPEKDVTVLSLLQSFCKPVQGVGLSLFWVECFFCLGIFLVALTLPFGHTNTIEAAGTILILLSWVGFKSLRKEWKLGPNPLHLPILLVFVTIAPSLVSSRDLLYSLNEIRGEFLTYTLVFFALVDFCKTKRNLYRVFLIFALANLFCLFVYVYLFYQLDFNQVKFLRYISIKKNFSFAEGTPKISTYFLLFTSFYYAALFFSQSKKHFFVSCFLLLANLFFLLVTYQRAALVALLPLFFLPLLFYKLISFKKIICITVLFLVGFALLFMVTPIKTKITGRTWNTVSQWYETGKLNKKDIDQNRFLWVIHFWKDVGKYPVTGLGYGKRNLTEKNTAPGELKGPGDTHNAFTNIAAETGVQGLAALLFLILLQGCLLVKGAFKAEDDLERFVFAGIFFYMCGFWIRMQFNSMYHSGAALAYWMLMGAGVGLWLRIKKRQKSNSSLPSVPSPV